MSKFQYRKVLEAIIYIAHNEPRLYWALKMLYFADIMHLGNYGRTITGDQYKAMKHGPVPFYSYNILTSIRGDGWYFFSDPEPNKALDVREKDIYPLREPDLDYLSQSDIECLNNSIEKYKNYTFKQLHDESSDAAYRAAGENDEIPLSAIIELLPNSRELKEYLEI